MNQNYIDYDDICSTLHLKFHPHSLVYPPKFVRFFLPPRPTPQISEKSYPLAKVGGVQTMSSTGILCEIYYDSKQKYSRKFEIVFYRWMFWKRLTGKYVYLCMCVCVYRGK